ncbi:MAG: DUF465 domain-containing protein [Pseudomonadota bacterium]
MSHTPHELAQDFPEHAQQISTLRQTDAHFAKLTDAYHAVNRNVHRAETRVEAVSDEHLVALRKRRMALKDEIYAALAI